MDNRTDTWPSHSEVRVASGNEVEAAANVFVPPGSESMASSCGCSTAHMHEHHLHEMHGQSPSKLDDLKSRVMPMVNQIKSKSVETATELRSRGMEKADMLKRELSHRSALARQSMARAQVKARDNARIRNEQMQQSMRTEPMKWAGIAAGSGVVLGLIGRYVHWRATRPRPQLVIIEAC